MKYEFLDKINDPSDLRILSVNDLNNVADELRYFLIDTVSQCGGHFGASLGAVELTIALHYSFNTPEDKIIWDVGHQCYGHKVLTGRKDQLYTIRKKGGLHPFPSREESEYDVFGVGHSSTSISAAIGMAIASSHKKEDKKVVAVIGDGGLSAGMAYEALNHMGSIGQDVLVILNDNEMSISPNVGAMTNYLTKILSSKAYTTVKEGSKNVLKKVPPFDQLAQKTEGHIKGWFAPGMLFEEMGINYYGPIDGHDTHFLVKTLKNLKKIPGPKLLHVITKKGKGYLPAESDPVKYHAVPVFNREVGVKKNINQKITYTKIFDNWVCSIAEKDPRIFAITPAMREGSGLVEFSKKFPERYIDVGIAEQHSITLAAGLACEGQKPIVCIYSTFLQRAYDQLIHDVALQNLDVLFAVDRAGFVGADGGTHCGVYDLSYLRCIPNMLIMAPSSEEECKNMLYTGYLHSGPAVVRYPRGEGLGVKVSEELENYKIGVSKKIHSGKNIIIFSFGSVLNVCHEVSNELNCTLIDMRFVKPIDENIIKESVEKYSLIVTVEDNSVMGGAGSAVNEVISKNNYQAKILNIGVPDKFFYHSTREEQLADSGISAENIIKKIKKYIENNNLYDLNHSSKIK
ncbi:MAG: 1-deoxy-D-xylulose-5-phosphate synthase [Gammaproteobacteria bacterium]|tara:strand:- start:398 stop:2284 length:1887 start_codon:yes stop_codon:yes gene_type:complete